MNQVKMVELLIYYQLCSRTARWGKAGDLQPAESVKTPHWSRWVWLLKKASSFQSKQNTYLQTVILIGFHKV